MEKGLIDGGPPDVIIAAKEALNRYLAYSNLDYSGQVCEIQEPPLRRPPIFLVGPPDKASRSYLSCGRYRGNSYVCGLGRFAAGQLWPNTVSTALLLIGPGVWYFKAVLPRAAEPLPWWHTSLGVSQAFLAVVLLVSFSLASFVNPGIVPRNDKVPPNVEIEMNGKPARRFLRINSVTVQQKFCNTCNVYRPPRSKHCSVCDNCILRFDHHCTWLGNCVGLHNYGYFVVLIYSATIFVTQCIYACFHVVYLETAEEYAGTDWGIFEWAGEIIANPLLLLLIVYCMLIFCAVALLSFYHSLITCKNLTTNEHVKNYYPKENPFDSGQPSTNCWQVFCHPERVLASGLDRIETEYVPFGSYWEDYSIDDQ